jgi:hypothetical protein
MYTTMLYNFIITIDFRESEALQVLVQFLQALGGRLLLDIAVLRDVIRGCGCWAGVLVITIGEIHYSSFFKFEFRRDFLFEVYHCWFWSCLVTSGILFAVHRVIVSFGTQPL